MPASDREGKPEKVGDRVGLTPPDPHDETTTAAAADATNTASRTRRAPARVPSSAVTSGSLLISSLECQDDSLLVSGVRGGDSSQGFLDFGCLAAVLPADVECDAQGEDHEEGDEGCGFVDERGEDEGYEHGQRAEYGHP